MLIWFAFVKVVLFLLPSLSGGFQFAV